MGPIRRSRKRKPESEPAAHPAATAAEAEVRGGKPVRFVIRTGGDRHRTPPQTRAGPPHAQQTRGRRRQRVPRRVYRFLADLSSSDAKTDDRGPQLTIGKKGSVILALAACNDIKEITALASCNHSDEIRDTPGSYINDRVKDEDALLGPACLDLLVSNEKNKIESKPGYYPEETAKQQNAVLLGQSSLSRISQPSVTGFGHFEYDSKLRLSSQVEVSSSPMIAMPSVPRTGKFQAPFGAFGQLTPPPQVPLLGIQSLIPHYDSSEESERAFTDQQMESTDEGYYLLDGAEQNFNAGSFIGAHLSRKRRECVSFQTTEGQQKNPVIMLCYKRGKKIVDKSVKGSSKSVATSEESTESENDNGKEVHNDASGSGILSEISEINTMTCIKPTSLKDKKDSQENSVHVITPNGVPVGIVELHQGNHTGALKGATKATSTSDNPGDANVFLSDSQTLYGNNTINADKCATSMEQDISEESFEQYLVMADGANDDLPPSVKSYQAISHDHQLCEDNVAAMVECKTSCVVATESVRTMSLVTLNGAAPKLLPSNMNSGLGMADHQRDKGLPGNMAAIQLVSAESRLSAISLPAPEGDIITTQSSTKKFAAEEQQGVSLEDHDSPVTEYAAESSQSIGKSILNQLFSTYMSNSTEAGPSTRLTTPEDTEGTMSSTRLKISPMWTHIEEMEIFKKVPQRPHFNPLQQLPLELSEAMALGLMVFFDKIAENIKNLNIQDDNALFKDKMKGLCLLEEHGFDVRHLRLRLETLLHMKNSRAELQDAIKTLEEKIAHKEIDSRQRGTQIGMLTMAARQLERQANLLRSIIKSSVSQQQTDALEISRLKTEAGDLEQWYLSVEQQFSSVVAAPW